MKITLELNEIDYGTLVEQILPLVKNKLAAKEGKGAQILGKLAEASPTLAGSMVDMLPQTIKDEIAVMLVNQNKERIVSAIMEYAQKKGLSFRIDGFEVE